MSSESHFTVLLEQRCVTSRTDGDEINKTLSGEGGGAKYSDRVVNGRTASNLHLIFCQTLFFVKPLLLRARFLVFTKGLQGIFLQ